jgi:hypothetical protein
MLTSKQIRYVLDLLAQEVVVPPTSEFPFTVTKKAFGYSKDVERSQLQAKLSIMLEAASRRDG